jgi:outer membrane protein
MTKLRILLLATVAGATLSGAVLAVGGPAQDANLLEIYRLALTSDPQLGAAEARRRAAYEAVPQSRAALLPSIGLSANTAANRLDTRDSGFSNTGISHYNSRGYTLSLTQPVYHRDLLVQRRQADLSVKQADARYTTAEQDLILRVATRYFGVLSAKDTLEFAQAEKTAIARQLEQTQQRFNVGLIAITDVHEAQARYDLSVSQEIAAANGLDTARETLREVTGQYFSELASLGDELPLVVPEPTDIDQWVKAALEQNWQLVAAQLGAEIAREDIDRRRSGHYPTLDLVASDTRSISGGGNFGNSDSEDTALSLQLNVPLYQGGLVDSQVREGRYLMDQAVQNLEQSRRSTESQARQAYLGVQASISQVKALKQALVSTQTALKATEAGYEVGTRTIVEVLDAQRDVFRAERDYATSRYSYILNILQLKQAAGTLRPDDLGEVNAWLKKS